MERRVIVIVGATGSGKTSLSLKLAAKLNTEIISADSRQIYKILDIGTAKPLKEELNQIKHHFIDSLNPDEPFNVSKYEDASLKIIDELHQKDKIPIVVGGSGLYIKALVDGLFNEVDTDEEFRRKLIDEREKFGNEYLYQKLIAVDKESANTMLPQNWKRVIRALEVFHLTGEPIWKFHAEHKREVDIEFLQNGLQWERELLYQNINNRVDKMIFDGLVGEIKSILENDKAILLHSASKYSSSMSGAIDLKIISVTSRCSIPEGFSTKTALVIVCFSPMCLMFMQETATWSGDMLGLKAAFSTYRPE